jgi:predicted alpha/beta hydrolase family esterase
VIQLLKEFKTPCATFCKTFFQQKCSLPTLHVYGKNDDIVLPSYSEKLAENFTQKTVQIHEGGHVIPSKAAEKNAYKEIIKKVKK